MFAATIAVSALLALLLAFSAARKLTHREEVVQSYLRAGVPEERLNLLAAVILAGAAGLIAGLFWAPFGIAAAAALVCYFLVAVAFHIRAGDERNISVPLALALLAAAAMVLRLATL
jgi:DoxX-like protein